MYIPYKNKQANPSNPTPVETIDCHDIQADVLATDLSENTKITGLKQLKTDTKIPTKAINALNEQLGNAQASASDALQRVKAVETRVARVENTGATLGSGSGVVDSDLARQMMKEVKNWEMFSRGAQTMDPPLTLDVTVDTKLENRLPTAVKNVKFYNAQPEESVNIYWNAEHLSGVAGQHELTARYEHGYTGQAPTMTVNILDQAASPYPLADHVYGMVLVQEGNTYGTWTRINRDFEVVDFDATAHKTWADMNVIDDPVYGQFVEFPITWVKTEVLEDGPYAGKTCYWTADGFVDDFHVHPAFIGADGNPHPLQIASWLASNKNGVPFSEDKGTDYKNYWHMQNDSLTTSFTYDDLISMGWINNELRPYSIYDHHFLARLMLTEFGTTDTRHLTVDGVYWGSSRINYHGIHDEFGLFTSVANGVSCLLFGVETNTETQTFRFMKTDGSLQIVDTEFAVRSGNGVYPVTCHVEQIGDLDLGDLFFADKVTASSTAVGKTIDDAKYGTFGGNTQFSGVSSSNLVATCYMPLSWRVPNYAETRYSGFVAGPFMLTTTSRGYVTMFRMSRCV